MAQTDKQTHKQTSQLYDAESVKILDFYKEHIGRGGGGGSEMLLQFVPVHFVTETKLKMLRGRCDMSYPTL